MADYELKAVKKLNNLCEKAKKQNNELLPDIEELLEETKA